MIDVGPLYFGHSKLLNKLIIETKWMIRHAIHFWSCQKDQNNDFRSFNAKIQSLYWPDCVWLNMQQQRKFKNVHEIIR